MTCCRSGVNLQGCSTLLINICQKLKPLFWHLSNGHSKTQSATSERVCWGQRNHQYRVTLKRDFVLGVFESFNNFWGFSVACKHHFWWSFRCNSKHKCLTHEKMIQLFPVIYWHSKWLNTSMRPLNFNVQKQRRYCFPNKLGSLVESMWNNYGIKQHLEDAAHLLTISGSIFS